MSTNQPVQGAATPDARQLRTILISVSISLMAVVASVSGLNVAQTHMAVEFGASLGTVLWIILWQGMVNDDWHMFVQNQLPGRPALDGPMLKATLHLVELQADAGIAAGDRDFTGYVSNVLFNDWDKVWGDAAQACAMAGELCARLRRWLQPLWGLRLPPVDYAHNDLNLSNILTDGRGITGVVDWDEFGLGSRALDFVVLAVDAERLGNHRAADHLLARAARIAGDDGLRCLVSYRAIAGLAHLTQERQAYGGSLADAVCVAISAILDRLQTTSSG